MNAAKTTTKPLALFIVIPVYNEEDHLEACLDSIAAQTAKPAGVILVDNNSIDGSLKIAEKFPFVTVLRESKQGVVYARNKGFNAVKTGIIGRIDADTVLPPDWVKDVQRFYDDPGNAQNCLTGGCYFYNIRLANFWGWCQGQIAFRVNRLIMGHYILFGSNMAIPVGVWTKTKKNVCLRTDVHEDLDLAIHAHRAGYKIAYHESLKVGVKMKRVRSAHDELWANLMLWPRTLRVHGLWTWIFGWFGALLMYCASPLGWIMETLARLFGKQPISE